MDARIVSIDNRRSRPGFLLLEVLLGMSVFALFLSATALTLLHGQQNTAGGGDRIRAAHAAIETVEAARSVRDGSFAALTAGTHGVKISSSNVWTLSGSKVTYSGGYATTLQITSLASDWALLSASTKWRHGIGRSGSILLSTELTDWRTTRSTGDWSGLTLEGSYAPGAMRFNAVAVSGDYAFVTSETSSGGAGLYVLDISNLASPSRVASSFSLGVAGYGVAVRGKRLYVVTADSSQEIRVYDITSPTTLLASNLVTSYDLSGSSRATSLALKGSVLFVGATYDATEAELYQFDVSNSGAVVLYSARESAATVNAVGASGTGVFLATSDTAGEMKEMRTGFSGGLILPSVSDYNITSTEAGQSIAVSGTSAVLGRTKGSSIQEMVLFNTVSGGGSPPPSPGPWYHEGSGSVVGMGIDGSRCYAFLAADSSAKAVQVVLLKDTSLPEQASYNSVNGPARGLFYDASLDRLFVAARDALLIFRPSVTASTCL